MAETAELMVMARRIARQRVKEELRKNGIGLSLVQQMEIHRAASLLMRFCRDELISEAKARLECSTSN